MAQGAVVVFEGFDSNLCADVPVFEQHTDSLGASIWLTWLITSFNYVSFLYCSSVQQGSYWQRSLRCREETQRCRICIYIHHFHEMAITHVEVRLRNIKINILEVLTETLRLLLRCFM